MTNNDTVPVPEPNPADSGVTAPLPGQVPPAADPAGATVPLSPAARPAGPPVMGMPPTMPPGAHHTGLRHSASAGAIAAMVIGTLLFGLLGFAAGWTIRGVATRVNNRGFMMGQGYGQGFGGAPGSGYGRGQGMGRRGMMGGQGYGGSWGPSGPHGYGLPNGLNGGQGQVNPSVPATPNQ